MINEAAFCLAEGIVASPTKLDLAMIFGTGFPPFRGGLCAYADSLGAKAVVEGLQKLAAEKGERFTPGAAADRDGQHGKEVLLRGAATCPQSKKRPRAKSETIEVESFLKTLFQGHIAEDLVFPFPEIPQDVKETVEAFASAYTDFDAANLDSEKMDAAHFFPREAVKAMGELGVLGMTIPEEYGGSGFSSAAYCRMTETIAPLDASASIVVGAHQSIGLKPLLLFGSDEQKKKWLPSLANGKMVAAFCLTEPEAGSDAGSLRTTAVYDPATNTYVLNGTKQWISNGGFARFFSVFARIPSDTPEKDKHREIACFAVVANEDGTPARPLARRRGEEARPLRVVDLPDHLRELPHPGREPHR